MRNLKKCRTNSSMDECGGKDEHNIFEFSMLSNNDVGCLYDLLKGEQCLQYKYSNENTYLGRPTNFRRSYLLPQSSIITDGRAVFKKQTDIWCLWRVWSVTTIHTRISAASFLQIQ